MTSNENENLKMYHLPLKWLEFQIIFARNDRSKFLEKLKQAIPTKSDKSCVTLGQNQQNSCVRYFSAFCVIIFPIHGSRVQNHWVAPGST